MAAQLPAGFASVGTLGVATAVESDLGGLESDADSDVGDGGAVVAT